MNVITIEEEAFKIIVTKIDNLEKRFYDLSNKVKYPTKEHWVDVQEALCVLKCSRKQLQLWRNKGLLPASQIQQKIYFKTTDLDAFFEKHYDKLRNKWRVRV